MAPNQSITWPLNQWSATDLREAVDYAVNEKLTRTLVTGRGSIDPKAIRNTIFKDMLVAAIPAGNC